MQSVLAVIASLSLLLSFLLLQSIFFALFLRQLEKDN